MSPSQAEPIHCPACGQASLLKRAPRYDGFRRAGETLSCAACGHVFDGEAAVPFRKRAPLAGLDPRTLPPPPRVFRGNENARLCRYCEHYVVNPFVQRCSRLNKEVAATDTCGQFRPKPEPPPAPPAASKPIL